MAEPDKEPPRENPEKERKLASGEEADTAVTDLEHVDISEHDLRTLRRQPGPINLAAYLIAICELIERYSYYGVTAVLVNFIQQPRASRTGASYSSVLQPGALDQGQRTATAISTFNSFWVYSMPLAGGIIADTYLGRYRTVMMAILFAFIGHILFVVSAIPTVLDNPSGALGVFAVGIIISGFGTGTFKATIAPLVADQIKAEKMHVETLKSGERVIKDPALTTARVFSYFYLFINLGALAGQIGCPYAERYLGFYVAFLLPTALLLLCPVVLFFGRNIYTRVPAEGSVVVMAYRAWRIAMRGLWTANPRQLVKRMSAPTFWNRAMPSNMAAHERTDRVTWDDNWIAELRRGVKAAGVFSFFSLYWVVYNQINNNLISQAATMELHGVPNDLIQNLDPVALVILIPVHEILVWPALRRLGFNVTPVKKIAAGFLFAALAMLCASIIQWQIYKQSPCGYQASSCDAPAPINVWSQVPSYVLIAMSEIYASITGLEYAFTKAPKNMRAVLFGFFYFQQALGSAINEALVVLAEDPLLIWNYGVFGVLSLIGGVLFYACNYKVDREEVALNALQAGHIGARADRKPDA